MGIDQLVRPDNGYFGPLRCHSGRDPESTAHSLANPKRLPNHRHTALDNSNEFIYHVVN